LNAAPTPAVRLSADSLCWYWAAKARALLVAQIWTRQLEDRWIRVNVVSAGTALSSAPATATEAARESSRLLLGTLPFERPNTPSEVAKAVVSVLCDAHSDVTGAELIVEGRTTRLRMLSADPTPVSLTSPDEIARTVVFLASDQSKGITGMELFVDCGMAPL
jgi:NAD(P)-dependent dehydrogenase (short-subunit alcohol dehydrogenase family)